MIRSFLLLLILLFLPACVKDLRKNSKTKADSIEEAVARFSILPDTPIGIKVKKVVRSEINPDDVQMFCNYQIGRKELVDFYLEEMERLGWLLIRKYEGSELLFEFQKPSGIVSILSIRKNKEFALTLINKKEAL